jgi:DNA-directed RNA polymerase subunit RPC12/RpoP
MAVNYGYRCEKCGREYDLSPETARSKEFFECISCGHRIATGFEPPTGGGPAGEGGGESGSTS